MKFEDLKKNLKLEIKTAYLISGSDIYLKQKAEEIIKDITIEANAELNSVLFSTDKLEPEKVIDACNTMPFFANKKLVVVKEYEKKKSDALVKKIEEYLQNPNTSTCLVLVSNEGSNYFDLLKKYAEFVDCNSLNANLLERFIDNELKKSGKKIEFIARELLIDYCNLDLSKINMELLKLISYLGDDDTITVEMIKENVNKDLEFEVYELTEALCRKNAQDTYSVLNTLLASKNSTSAILATIYRHFRRLFYIAVSEGYTNKELADKLDVKEFAIKKASGQVKAFGAVKLKKINDLYVEVDYKTKTGKLDAEAGINFIVLKILNI
ncbi:MAG: DNA polymerase III subunit delta [Clostridia bacterium]|nr:DNA polymerase III subunit delta [Clostridia bacterium]